MSLYDRDYYSWRAWIDRTVKRLVKNLETLTFAHSAITNPNSVADVQHLTAAQVTKLTDFPSATTATLTVVGWAANSQTVNVTGITADSIILMGSPSTDAQYLAYGAAQIRATSQGIGTITFTCTTTPTIELIINILILG